MIDRDNGDSHVIGEFILIAVGIILAGILLLYCLGMLNGFFPRSALAPPYIKIISVLHTTPQGNMNLASRIFIENTGTKEYNNRNLAAVFLKNGEEQYAVINTLHGEGFIPTEHFGVATIGGSGCRGEYFSPGEMIEINLKDGLYKPGDEVELRIYEKSADTALTPIIGSVVDKQYMQDWVEENFFSKHPGYRIMSQHKYTA